MFSSILGKGRASGRLLTGVFSLLLAANSIRADVHFVVMGDSGTGDKWQKKIAKQMISYHDKYAYPFVITVGDNLYPPSRKKHAKKRKSDSYYYDKLFEQPYAELLERGVEFYASLGNHDMDLRDPMAKDYPFFNMNGERYYTFEMDSGLVQFFALDTNRWIQGKADEEQLKWLEDELDKSEAIWKIVYFHHSIYSSAKEHGSSGSIRKKIEPIFINKGVQVVFQGHDHVYERIKPRKGIHYFVSGAAGQLRKGDLQGGSSITLEGDDDHRHFIYVDLTKDILHYEVISEKGAQLYYGQIKHPSLATDQEEDEIMDEAIP